MQCRSCQHQNTEGSRFCAGCGKSLMPPCGGCGALLTPGAAFCAQCGAPVAPATPTGGERRQLTVMFCDLAGFTELSQQLDPEELGEVLASYQQTCVRAVNEFNGHVAQYLGDGVLVYFGFPRALEDAAQSALRAALMIQQGLAEMNVQRRTSGAREIHARIGVHTGQVVVKEVGADARRETLALGDTTNVAARLQAMAESDGICVSAATLRLVPGLFRTRSLGTPGLKGVTEEVEVHALDGLADNGLRFHDRSAVTPIRGRDEEMATLRRCWDRVQAGTGQAVLVSGEPGIGKSRLVQGLDEQIAGTPHSTLELECSPYKAGTAFQPAVDLLARELGFEEQDTPEHKLEKLEERLGRLPGLVLSDFMPYVGLLLGLPESDRFPLEPQAPELQRERTLQALLAPFYALANQQPLLVLCEDLHWCDPSTLELLGRLIEATPRLRILLVMTFRTDFKPPWDAAPWLHPVPLERLSKQSTMEVLRSIEGENGPLPRDMIELLADRADGVPLFAEELVRTVLESHTSASASSAAGERVPLEIPSTLRDSLMARLDRLGTSKQVARVAATLGRTFSYELIENVADLDALALQQGLGALVQAKILYESGDAPGAQYTFKHALFQETAYQSQLKTVRRTLHRRIAETLKERFPNRVRAEPEVIAHHCTAGGLINEAVGYYQQAGEQASVKVAYQEAHGYFSRALDLLSTQDEDRERQIREIDLCVAKAPTLVALDGYGNDELKATVQRADELLAAIGKGPQQVPGLLKLMALHTNNPDRARGYASALIDVGEEFDIQPLRIAGYIMRGGTAMTVGTVAEACADMEKGIRLSEQTELPPPESAFDIDPLAMGYSTYAIALVHSGRPDTAAHCVRLAVERGHALNHVRSLASALQIGAQACYSADDPATTGELAGESLALIAGRGFHHLDVSARVLDGWSRARRGDFGALEDMIESLESAESQGVVAGMPRLYVASAEAELAAGHPDRALEQLDRSGYRIARTGKIAFSPDSQLVRAQILLETGMLEGVETLLKKTLKMCERGQTPWLAVLAATLLGRLALETRENVAEAHDLLAALYSRFEEGFETDRLIQARTVRDQLAKA